MSDQNPEKKDGLKLVEAVVAPGRTIYLERGKPTEAGSKVRLPADEVLHLRKSGHLVDPDAVAIPLGDGPSFGTKEGPTVKGVA